MTARADATAPSCTGAERGGRRDRRGRPAIHVTSPSASIDRVAVAAPDRLGDAGDAAAVAVDAVEDDDPARRRRARADDVAEHGSRLDRGELARVADEDQPRLRLGPPRRAGPSGTARPSRSRRRSRRRAAAGCRGRGGSGCGCPGASRAAGAAWTRRGADSRARTSSLTSSRPRPRGSPRRAGRPPCRSARRARPAARARPRSGLLEQQRDDPRDGRRLAGARAAGDDRQAAPDRGLGGQPLTRVGLAAEQPREPVGEHRVVDAAGRARRAARAGRPRSGAPRASSGRGRASCPPAGAGRRRARSPPSRGRATRPRSGHGSAVRSTGSSASTVAVSRIVRDVDVHVTEPRTADGERRSQQDPLVGLAGQRGEPLRDVHVGRRRARRPR